jgi:hypothetical protein
VHRHGVYVYYACDRYRSCIETIWGLIMYLNHILVLIIISRLRRGKQRHWSRLCKLLLAAGESCVSRCPYAMH